MLTILLVAPLFAGTARVCSETEANASLNGAWSLLGKDDRDGDTVIREGVTLARSSLDLQLGGERAEDLCPADDPMGSMDAPRFELLEVELPKPGGEAARGGCYTRALAQAIGHAEGEAFVNPNRIHARATGQATMDLRAANSGRIDVDGGGGAAFLGEWTYRSGGPNTLVTGTVTISLADAYAGVWVNVPGLVYVESWEGRVNAWYRQGDRYERYEGPAPVTLEVETVRAGRAGSVCGSGSTSIGALADEATSGFSSSSSLEFEFNVAPSQHVPHLVEGDTPPFAPCGCTPDR